MISFQTPMIISIKLKSNIQTILSTPQKKTKHIPSFIIYIIRLLSIHQPTFNKTKFTTGIFQYVI